MARRTGAPRLLGMLLLALVAVCLAACGDRRLTLPPGFEGTKTLRGTLGGPAEARVWGPDCSGFVATEPNHEVLSEARLPYVRVMVQGGGVDTTLVLLLPDGTYRCNDDGEGHNPVVQLALPAGLTKIWVGGYRASATGPYRLGISTDRELSVESLGSPGAH